MFKLGLIGQSIAQSRSPALHEMLGEIHGLPVSYVLHEPEDSSPEAFRATLQQLRDQGYRGTNVTFPYKQLAVAEVDTIKPSVERVGSTNTLALGERVVAYNTDYTGFIRGYRRRNGERAAGRVVLVGAGGVGRAVAFALFEVGATEVLISDLNRDSANSLAVALNASGCTSRVLEPIEVEDAVRGADGLVNCTPVGHYKSPGMPVPADWIGSQQWVFDAVYTPIDTEFLQTAHARGLSIVSGFDLFIFQGIDAFEIFTGIEVTDPAPVIERFLARYEITSELIG
ncbi:shikimate dehydrogenase family protein [Marinobacter bohaiensis]|uniref:shikimate dehydrogenase family protein n=1 Tax=Marinobacter bohaiensis TaxID=2201898 RepID=UPI000DACAB34|nr:shikimate dehydrogenase [Marinobacter bohaiensis]